MPTPANQGRRFKLEELKTNPDGLTIYICLPSIRLSTHRAFFRLFVNLAFASIEQLGEQVKPAVKTKDGKPIKTLFMLDEAYSMGKMNIITTAAPLFASYGVPHDVLLARPEPDESPLWRPLPKPDGQLRDFVVLQQPRPVYLEHDRNTFGQDLALWRTVMGICHWMPMPKVDKRIRRVLKPIRC
jgi:hypothetical protein